MWRAAALCGPHQVQQRPEVEGTKSPHVDLGSGLGTVNYQLLKNTFVTLAAAYLIVPTSFGNLQKTTTAGFTLAHDAPPLAR